MYRFLPAILTALTSGAIAIAPTPMAAQSPSVVVYPFRSSLAALRGFYVDSLGVLVASKTVEKLVNAQFSVKDRAYMVECVREGNACQDDPGDVLYVGTVLEIGEGQTWKEKAVCTARRELCRNSIRVKLQGQLIDARDRRVLATATSEATASGSFTSLASSDWAQVFMQRDQFWTTQVGRAIENASVDLFGKMRHKLPAPGAANAGLQPSFVSSASGARADAAPRTDLGALRDVTVAVVLPEVIIARPVPDPAAETEIQRYLIAQGLRVKDDARVRELRENKALLSVMNGTMTTAQMHEFQAEYGIDILVIGEAFAEVPAVIGQGGAREARARVEIKAKHMGTGDVVFTDGVHATGRDITEATAGKKALAQGGRAIAPKLLDGMVAYYNRGGGGAIARTEGTSLLQLEVSGFTRLADASAFLDAVGKLNGVKRATRKSYAGGIVIADVEVEQARAEALGADLETHASMQKFGLGLTEASTSKIVGNVKSARR